MCYPRVLHQKSSNGDKRDANFQGFGRFMTGSTGEYYFRTVKPVSYPGRCPHIHVAITMKGREANAKDGIYMGIKDLKQRESVTITFAPLKSSKLGELSARFDLVLGVTPSED